MPKYLFNITYIYILGYRYVGLCYYDNVLLIIITKYDEITTQCYSLKTIIYRFLSRKQFLTNDNILTFSECVR